MRLALRRRLRMPTMPVLILLMLALLSSANMLSGCGGPPEPLDEPPSDPAALEAMELAKQQNIREAFGPVGATPKSIPPEPPKKEGIPFDTAYPPPTIKPMLRVAVMNNPGQRAKGDKAALIIGTYQKEYLEKILGMSIRVAYISEFKDHIIKRSGIRFRPNFLKPALEVASVLPKQQLVEPMAPKEVAKREVDLIVYVGENYK